MWCVSIVGFLASCAPFFTRELWGIGGLSRTNPTTRKRSLKTAKACIQRRRLTVETIARHSLTHSFVAHASTDKGPAAASTSSPAPPPIAARLCKTFHNTENRHVEVGVKAGVGEGRVHVLICLVLVAFVRCSFIQLAIGHMSPVSRWKDAFPSVLYIPVAPVV